MTPLHLRNLPTDPRFNEVFDHVAFLSFMAKWIKPERYLELGVRGGQCFKSVSAYCKEAHGVDLHPIPYALLPGMVFHQCSTDAFFQALSPETQFDMVFVDADHSHEQSLKDFLNAARHVIEDGFIFLHDTYPYGEHLCVPEYCADAFKTPLYIKSQLGSEFEVVTLPFCPGLTIVKKTPRNRQLLFLPTTQST